MSIQLKTKLNSTSAQTICQAEYAKKIDKIEIELLKLKKGGIFSIPSIPISLKGILKGIKITEEDIKKAKKSLFKEIKI